MNRGLIEFTREELEKMVNRLDGIPRSINEAEIAALPQGGYDGPVKVVDTVDALNQALDIMRGWDIAGIDTETRPSFRKGERHTPALLQVAGPGEVFLFRINMLGFAPGLRSFMNNKDVIKIGIALENDIPELARMGRFSPAGMVDLNQLFTMLGFKSVGVRKLAALLLNIKISKGQQTSNWENPELKPAQIRYAATDAWVCREIYLKLMGIY
ncbi:MAG: 3'-5' exonuclease domain-containing protein 2 [Bacteroidales bacterium]|jgi:ribonuclease D|nr:3'-5' exonuclease domain-containing protein 2 [Bacteroidales bacterium]NPV35478.1 3'-5' exonuclease domain-containing protein 2 [Bacteroidales bacterium]